MYITHYFQYLLSCNNPIIKKHWCRKRDNLFNCLPDNKILALTKLKVFADDKFNVAEEMNAVFDSKDIVEKEKMLLVTSVFSFTHNLFKSLLF